MLRQTSLGRSNAPEETFKDFFSNYAKDIKESEEFKNTKKIEDFGMEVDAKGVKNVTKSVYRLNKGRLNSFYGSDDKGNSGWYAAVEKFVNGKRVYSADIVLDRFVNETYYHDNGQKSLELQYDSAGILNKTSGPSVIHYNRDGSICQEEFWINGKQQLTASSLNNCNVTSTNLNIDGQEVCVQLTTLKEEGNRVVDERTLVNNKLHSINTAPSIIKYDANGKENYRAYHKEGKLHKENGPAVITPKYERYFMEGEEMSKPDFFEKIDFSGFKIDERFVKEYQDSWKKDKEKEIYNQEKSEFDKVKNDLLNAINTEKKKQQTLLDQYPGSIKVINTWHNGKSRRVITYNDKVVVEDENLCRIETLNKGAQLHSFDDKPAIKYLRKWGDKNSFAKKEWYQNGKRHRENGAAIEYASGLKEYWYEGKKYSKKEYEDLMNFNNVMGDVKEALEDVISDIAEPMKDFAKTLKDYRVERKDNRTSHYLKDSLVREDFLNEHGDIVEIRYYNEEGRLSGPMHGFPAVIYVNKDGSFSNIYYENGEPVKDGVQRSEFYENMQPKEVFIWENGKYVENQRFNEKGEIASYERYDRNGVMMSSAFYTDTHSTINIYHENGRIKSSLRINRNLALDGEGAFKSFDEDGILQSVASYKNGIYHCYEGRPSLVEYKQSVRGNKITESYIEGDGFMVDKPSILVKAANGDVLIKHFTDRDGKILKTIDFTKTESEDANKTLEKKESGLKVEATSAGYRIAANQVSKAVKRSILMLMQSKGMKSSKLKHLEDVLDSEIGDALVSVSIGYVLSMDKFKDSERATRLAREFRIEGMATAGNVIVDSAVNYILPSIMKEAEREKFRVEEVKELAENNEQSDNHEEKDEGELNEMVV